MFVFARLNILLARASPHPPPSGCRLTVGDYDVEIPSDTSSGEYKIRVGRFGEDELFGCSGAFEIVADDNGGDGDSSDSSDSSDSDEGDNGSQSYMF